MLPRKLLRYSPLYYQDTLNSTYKHAFQYTFNGTEWFTSSLLCTFPSGILLIGIILSRSHNDILPYRLLYSKIENLSGVKYWIVENELQIAFGCQYRADGLWDIVYGIWYMIGGTW